MRAVTYSVACSLDRESNGRIASRFGLTQPTLSRWIREADGAESGFHEVAIVLVECGRATPPASRALLRLVSPNGYLIEGLDPELLVSLLQVLG